MKNFLHEKFTEDHTNIAKEREKSKALFLEVVRLGESHEKNTEFLQNLNMQFEGRIKAIESKFQIGERSISSLVVKGDQSINNISDWNEKLEKRIQNLESNLLTLGVNNFQLLILYEQREQIKDKDSLNKVEITNQRMTDDIRGLLISLQSDYTQR